MDEKSLIDKFIECRAKRKPVSEFACELLNHKFNVEQLVEYALKKRQNLPLGYVCEVISETLPETCNGVKKRISELADRLYSVPKSWQYMYSNLEDFVKGHLEKIANSRNIKWMVYTELEREIKDVLAVYLRKNPLLQ